MRPVVSILISSFNAERWIKQTLDIKHFIGRSENAVRIQIAVALIAYLLLRLARMTQGLAVSPRRFAELVRGNLMHRKTLRQIVEPELRPPIQPDQQQAVLWA